MSIETLLAHLRQSMYASATAYGRAETRSSGRLFAAAQGSGSWTSGSLFMLSANVVYTVRVGPQYSCSQ